MGHDRRAVIGNDDDLEAVVEGEARHIGGNRMQSSGFGAAQKAMAALVASRGDTYHVLILDLGKVPSIDATGLVALENAVANLLKRKKQVIIAGPLPRPHQIWDKAEIGRGREGLRIAPTLDEAIEQASTMAPPK